MPLASATASRRAVWAQRLRSAGGATADGDGVTHVALAPELSRGRWIGSRGWEVKEEALIPPTKEDGVKGSPRVILPLLELQLQKRSGSSRKI